MTINDKPTRIKITNEGNNLVLDFDYNLDFIEALKAAVPAKARTYDPETKLWRVIETRKADVLDLARRMFVGAYYEYQTEEGALVNENLRTGQKTVMESMF